MSKSHSHLGREARTVQIMVRLYCHQQHGTSQALCGDCTALVAYANKRLAKCPFQANKPTCAKCTVHCYRADMRERMRAVMRYAGPRMLLHHPLLALHHLMDSLFRRVPEYR